MEIQFILITLLVAFAHLANATMDSLAHKFQDTVFDRWQDEDTWFGRAIAWWAGPESHQNKHFLDEHPTWGPILSWAFWGPLAFIFSAWHFAKSLFLTAYQVAIIVALPDYLPGSIDFYLLLFYFKLIGGIVFELSYPNPRTKFKELLQRGGIEAQIKVSPLRDLVITRPKLITRVWITFCVVGFAYTQHFLGGLAFNYPHMDSMGLPDWAGLIWIALCGFGLYYIRYLAQTPTSK